jgi:hypothetical protein
MWYDTPAFPLLLAVLALAPATVLVVLLALLLVQRVTVGATLAGNFGLARTLENTAAGIHGLG